MRVNVYAEEMTGRVELVYKREFTGLRFWLELPVTLHPAISGQSASEVSGPFIHGPGDDDSSAVTFWGKRDMIPVLEKALELLRSHYDVTKEIESAKS